MKIDQSVCNDWAPSPVKNCLKACGLKIKIASERRASAGLFSRRCLRMYLHFLFSACFFFFLARASAGVFFPCRAPSARFVVHGHCLYPGAVLPVRSQVFIKLDSGRRIARPQAATHPSFQGLPKTAFNMHYSFPCCYKPNFQLLAIVVVFCAFFFIFLVGSGRASACGVVCCVFRVTTLFSLNWCFCSCHFLFFFFERHCPRCTVLAFPVVRRLPPPVDPARVCLHIPGRSSQCVMMTESVCSRVVSGKNSLQKICSSERNPQTEWRIHLWETFPLYLPQLQKVAGRYLKQAYIRARLLLLIPSVWGV